MQRTPVTGLAESGHRMFRPGEDRLDVAIAAVADPAGNAASLGMPLGEGTKANALHAAADPHTDDFFRGAHANSAAGSERSSIVPLLEVGDIERGDLLIAVARRRRRIVVKIEDPLILLVLQRSIAG